eukprot:m.285141 g.285141  ORF g.285141 m.285141 type:complete len:415 (+) comp16200_c1_seq18:3773-5017(+)
MFATIVGTTLAAAASATRPAWVHMPGTSCGYIYILETASWETAARQCSDLRKGSRLAAIDSLEESSFVRSRVAPKGTPAWVFGFHEDDEWNIRFEDEGLWAKDFPRPVSAGAPNACVFQNEEGLMENTECNLELGAVCKWCPTSMHGHPSYLLTHFVKEAVEVRHRDRRQVSTTSTTTTTPQPAGGPGGAAAGGTGTAGGAGGSTTTTTTTAEPAGGPGGAAAGGSTTTTTTTTAEPAGGPGAAGGAGGSTTTTTTTTAEPAGGPGGAGGAGGSTTTTTTTTAEPAGGPGGAAGGSTTTTTTTTTAEPAGGPGAPVVVVDETTTAVPTTVTDLDLALVATGQTAAASGASATLVIGMVLGGVALAVAAVAAILMARRIHRGNMDDESDASSDTFDAEWDNDVFIDVYNHQSSEA